MPGEGEERPPDRPERPDRPDYKVYRSGRGGGGEDRGEIREPPKKAGEPERGDGEQEAKGGDTRGERPEYRVYRSRPSLRDRFSRPDIGKIREAGVGGFRERLRRLGGAGGRRWLRWILIGAAVWILISFLAFAISAQTQKGKLDDAAREELEGGPDVLMGQNILILGGDSRSGRVGENASGTEGQGPPRADTIMVLHTSLTSFRKLSIPRDTYAAIPGCGTQKINASFACNTNDPGGNPALTIRTVREFLGIDIHHIVIIDFDGFADFINTLGGVEVDVPARRGIKGAVICGDVDGGKQQGGVSLKLRPGEHTLEGDKALALARLRINECDPSEDDTDRAARQQLILNAIKGRLTSITRLPYNFVKGPWIGWNAPRAFVSDMGGLTLPQVALAAIFGGSGETNVLEPSGAGPGSSLVISQGECRRAVEKLTGGDPDRDPVCSP